MAFIESGQTFDKEKHRAKMKKMMENMDITRVMAAWQHAVMLAFL